jgi:hypothetical protein
MQLGMMQVFLSVDLAEQIGVDKITPIKQNFQNLFNYHNAGGLWNKSVCIIIKP